MLYRTTRLSQRDYDPPARRLFVLGGQSNMVGLGVCVAGDDIHVSRVRMVNASNAWTPAKHPVHGGAYGYGLSLDAAKTILAGLPCDETIGLIPCAVGASAMTSWVPGAVNYDALIAKVAAMSSAGVVAGVLWHQGEAENTAGEIAIYVTSMMAMISGMRAAWGLTAAQCPFIFGQVCQESVTSYAAAFKAAQWSTRDSIQNCRWIHSDGLTSIGDDVHFDRASMITFGQRYGAAYLASLP